MNKKEILNEHENWNEQRIQDFKKSITCSICGQTPKPDEWSAQVQGFALIVDSIWFYPILGIVGLAILYWFN